MNTNFDSQPFTLRDAVRGIRRRLIAVVLIFATVVGLVGAATLLSTKKYDSQAKIFVRLGRENIGLEPTTTLGEASVISSPMSREAEINSVAHMIRSRNLFEDVIDEIGVQTILDGVADEDEEESDAKKTSMLGSLASWLTDVGVLNDVPDRERAIIKFEKDLSVDILDRSNVIMVGFESEDPKLSQKIVSLLVEKHLEWHILVNRTSGASVVLEKQAAAIGEELERREKAIEKFRGETGMLSSELQKRELVSRIALLKKQLVQANVLASSLESEVAALQSSFEKIPETLVVSRTVGTGNEGVDGMRQQLYQMEIELETLLGKHTRNHPEVIAKKTAIKRAKQILTLAEKNRTESVIGANPVHNQIQIDLLKKRPHLAAAQATVKSIKDELVQIEATSTEFSSNERRYREMSRDIEVQDEKYRRFFRSMSQSNVDSLLQQNKLSNISVSQPASFNQKPVRPNKLLNLIIGLALGALCSLGTAVSCEYMWPRPSIEQSEPVRSTSSTVSNRVRDRVTATAET